MPVPSCLLTTGLALLGAWGGRLEPDPDGAIVGAWTERVEGLEGQARIDATEAFAARLRPLATAGDGQARLWLLEHDPRLDAGARLALARDLVREHAHQPALLLPRFPRLVADDPELELDDVRVLLRGLAESAGDPELAGAGLLALAERTAPLACEDPALQEVARGLCREVGARWPRAHVAAHAARVLWRLEHLVVGRTAPGFLSRDARGNQLASEDLRGQVVVVNLWRFAGVAWRARMPEERRLCDRFWDEGFVWLGVNRDPDPEAFGRTCDDRDINWTQHAWEGGAARPICQAWHVGDRPLLVLLDAEGVIRGIDLEPRQLESRIASLLRELRVTIEARDVQAEEDALGGR